MPGEDLRPFIAILTALLLPVVTGQSVAQAQSPTSVEHIVAQKVQPMLPEDASSGVAVAVRIDGKTEFFNFGTADRAKNRPVTADSVFNLASVGKIFATTLLAQAVKRGELGLDDPVAKYITKLQQGGDIRRVTLGQLASHTSGLPRVPEQYERWHKGKYTFPDFVRFLNSWKADDQHQPGQQYLYSNAAMVLLRVALERRFQLPFATLMARRLTGPLGMSSTALPLPPALLGRAVQGYGPRGRPIGRPGDEEGVFAWTGAGQIYSSARDMATFLAANLDELPDHQPIEAAMALAQQGVFTGEPPLHTRLGVAGHEGRRSHHHRQEWRPAKYFDLYRLRPAAEARRRHPLEPRRAGRHKGRTANPACTGAGDGGAVGRGR